jgi:hypothetical protein
MGPPFLKLSIRKFVQPVGFGGGVAEGAADGEAALRVADTTGLGIVPGIAGDVPRAGDAPKAGDVPSPGEETAPGAAGDVAMPGGGTAGVRAVAGVWPGAGGGGTGGWGCASAMAAVAVSASEAVRSFFICRWSLE